MKQLECLVCKLISEINEITGLCNNCLKNVCNNCGDWYTDCICNWNE